ncbi:MAG: class I SAM-dependent methyltransferase [Actinobacteria bacterium]|nr:MAG: class I SAM-dependent methyltransferase [Actinomycetota bacterium]
MSVETNEWATAEHAHAYLERAPLLPRRDIAYDELLALLPASPRRVLDLGTGDGHVLSLIGAPGVGVDFSPAMLDAARTRYAGRSDVEVVDHNLNAALPDMGSFDVVVSAFAIHHCSHARKRELYAEVFELLEPGGVFANLEHVSSPTEHLHDEFLALVGASEDPSNQLLDVETQLRWLREIGFAEVECFWKWRELALLAGIKP